MGFFVMIAIATQAQAEVEGMETMTVIMDVRVAGDANRLGGMVVATATATAMTMAIGIGVAAGVRGVGVRLRS